MPGTPSYIQLPPDSTGKKLQTWDNTISGNDVFTEAATPTDSTGTEKATATNPLRVDPTGTTIQPVSASSLPLPSNAAEETGGNLAAIKADTDKIPSLGQALAAASVPVVLTALQVTALTPPAAITNYAEETGGNLATIAGAISSSVVQENVKNWGGTAVSAPPATTVPATGSEVAPVVKALPRKSSTILYNSSFAASTNYDSGWIDTQATGDLYISLAVYITGNNANTGLNVTTSPDYTNTNLTTTIYAPGGTTINTLYTVAFAVKDRYYRVQFATTTGQNLTNVEIVVTASQLDGVPTNGVVYSSAASVGGAGTPYPLTVNSFGALGIVPNVYKSGSPDSGITYPWYDLTSTQVAPVVTIGGVSSATVGTNVVSIRIPNIFHTVQATSSGNTAVWTPTSGKKFRLMRFFVQVTAAAALASAGVLTITFQDSTTGIPIAFDVYLPATSISTPLGDAFNSGWIDLGNGVISATANNVLNINLSGAVSSGNVRVTCCGTEE